MREQNIQDYDREKICNYSYGRDLKGFKKNVT